MKPWLGADVLVNVDASHNNGSPVAPGRITALLPDGRVNVRVLYDGPPAHHLGHRHRPEWLTGVTVHDTTDPAEANRQGLYGAFWPAAPSQDLTTITGNQEKIMTAQDDINAAVSAIQAVAADLTGAASAIKAEVDGLNGRLAAAGHAQVDTSALGAAVAALQQARSAVHALEPAAPAPAPAAEAAAPSGGTAGSTVSGGDTGSGA